MLSRKLRRDQGEEKEYLLLKILEQTTAMINGDYSVRTVTDFDDDNLTRLANNLNVLCDKAQLQETAQGGNLDQTINTFIEVISSFTNLDFKQKLPISENGTVMDAIATGINMLGDELENSTASRTELVRERNRLNEAQALAKVGSWEIQRETGRFSTSKEYRRILGLHPEYDYSFAEVIEIFQSRLHQDDLQKFQSMMSGTSQLGEHFVMEFRIFMDDGRMKHLMCNIEIHKNNEGDLVQFVKGTIQDITESKLVEEVLKEARRKAEDLNLAKSRFLANMSHEIRTPLNGILGLTEIMLHETKNSEHKKYLELIRYSGKNLTQLINDTLDLSKIESGKLQLENIPFNFKETVTSNIRPYQFLAQQKGCILHYSIDDQIPADVIGDPTRISQIIINLLSNAIKFTDEGTIDVSFHLDQRTADEICIRAVVKDNGIGIPADRIDNIFKTFSQADESINRKYGGTGLGLSIVKSLLQLMKGDIAVESADNGKGTIFTSHFFLEVQKAVPIVQTSTPRSQERLSFTRPVELLLVDDNKINLLVAKKLLENLGGVVTTACNGLEAIDRAMERDFDLILMDIQMPELNGYDATIRLRELSFKKPIIALSANAYPEDVKNSINAGMNDHIQKPFSGERLLEVINKYL